MYCFLSFKIVWSISSSFLTFWSAGPRRPSDQSDAIVAGFLCMFLPVYISMSRRRSPTLFSVFGFAPSATALSKRSTRAQINILNCLPPLLALCRYQFDWLPSPPPPPGHPGAFAPKCVPSPRAFAQQKMPGGRANK